MTVLLRFYMLSHIWSFVSIRIEHNQKNSQKDEWPAASDVIFNLE